MASGSKTGGQRRGGSALTLLHTGLVPVEQQGDGLNGFFGGFSIIGKAQCGRRLPDNVDRRPHVDYGD